MSELLIILMSLGVVIIVVFAILFFEVFMRINYLQRISNETVSKTLKLKYDYEKTCSLITTNNKIFDDNFTDLAQISAKHFREMADELEEWSSKSDNESDE